MKLQRSLEKKPEGKHLIVLHTKGSHYNYTQRYPRELCPVEAGVYMQLIAAVPRAPMINSYDNSVTYVDHFIDSA